MSCARGQEIKANGRQTREETEFSFRIMKKNEWKQTVIESVHLILWSNTVIQKIILRFQSQPGDRSFYVPLYPQGCLSFEPFVCLRE